MNELGRIFKFRARDWQWYSARYNLVLKDVNEFYEEGNTLKHCVFTNEYFLKPDTLVFSAQIDGQRIETVEVSLESFQVIQSRGLFNQNTEFHDQIVSIVNRNVHLIRERMTA